MLLENAKLTDLKFEERNKSKGACENVCVMRLSPWWVKVKLLNPDKSEHSTCWVESDCG